MQLKVDKALNSKGMKFPFELCEKIVYNDGRISFDDPFTVRGEYTFNGNDVKIKGRIEGTMYYHCDRCNGLHERPIDLRLEERVFSDDTLDADYTFESGIISLDDMVFHNVLLSLPLQLLCDENCKGICLGCYANLNTEECKCK